jgi:hypothetical protein
MGRHRAPTGAPTQVGGEGTPSHEVVACPAGLPTQFERSANLRSAGLPGIPAAQHTARPKTLKERIQWMADNLPGFREELDQVDAIKRRATLKGA